MKKLNKLVAATFNMHKVQEIREFFAPFNLEILALSDFCKKMPDETGDTFAENARLKAVYGYSITGLPVLADDSGLEVQALGRSPGVFSARYAGENASDADNNCKLLVALKNSSDRSACFRCSMALVMGTSIIEADGFCHGTILETPRGQGGFGYDPLFLLPEKNLTMAELSRTEKNKISHRAKALANLVKELKSRGVI